MQQTDATKLVNFAYRIAVCALTHTHTHIHSLSLFFLPAPLAHSQLQSARRIYLFASFICYFLSVHLPSPLSFYSHLSLFALRFDDPDANADALVCACVCGMCVAASSNAFLLIQLAAQRELPRNWQRL